MQQEKNTYYFPIPGYVQKEIHKKGFYLYEWVDETELKASIERDFLKIFDNFGIALATVLILPTVMFSFTGGFESGLTIYMGMLFITSIILFIYIFALSLSRSMVLRKIAFIIITNNYFRILDSIEPIKENSLYGNKNIQKIGEVFEEELFRDSQIKYTKEKLFSQVQHNLLSGYEKIFSQIDRRDSSQDSGQLVLFIGLLYTIYLVSIGLVYLVGIFLVMVLGNIFAFINRKYLLIRRNKVIQISEGFEKINDYSQNIEQEKQNFLHLIQEAQTNNWIDGLLLKLESSIDDTNNYASKTVDTTKKLKKNILNSDYKEMFDFDVFQNWIKNEITTPLEEIKELLNINLQTLTKTIDETGEVAKNYEQKREQGALLVSKKRLEIQKEEIIKLITQLSFYIEKLKN